jgi:hypothetical protein
LELALRLAVAQLACGDAAGYRRTCTGLLQGMGPEPAKVPPDTVNNVAWAVALGPSGAIDYGPLLRALEQVSARATPGSPRHIYLKTIGALLYRTGRHKEALAQLEEGLAANKGRGMAADWALMALAHHGLGNAANAREYLKRVPTYQPEPGKLSWENMEAEVLRREAAALIKP